MELTPADIIQIVEAFEASDWQHLRVSLGDSLLELSKSGPIDPAALSTPPPAPGPVTSETIAPPRARPAAAPPALGAGTQPQAGAGTTSPPAAGSVPAGLDEIVAPSVGVFWRAPSPTSPPFVSEGDAVAETDTVCIVEVMKLMNHVSAGVSGTVHSVLAENGQMVERGQALFLIKRAP